MDIRLVACAAKEGIFCFYLPLLWSLLSLSDSCAYRVPEHRRCEYKSVAQQDFGEVVFVLVAPLPADRPAAFVPDTPRRDTGDIRRQSRVRSVEGGALRVENFENLPSLLIQ